MGSALARTARDGDDGNSAAAAAPCCIDLKKKERRTSQKNERYVHTTCTCAYVKLQMYANASLQHMCVYARTCRSVLLSICIYVNMSICIYVNMRIFLLPAARDLKLFYQAVLLGLE